MIKSSNIKYPQKSPNPISNMQFLRHNIMINIEN